MLEQVAGRHPVAGDDLASASADQRHLAYLDWACTGAIDAADLVIFADPHLRVTLTERWEDQLSRWLGISAGVDADRGARLLAVRLMADGLWFDRASGLDVGSAEQLDQTRELARDLLGGDA